MYNRICERLKPGTLIENQTLRLHLISFVQVSVHHNVPNICALLQRTISHFPRKLILSYH